MQYRIDKRSGNSLAALGFGCMRFPKNLGAVDQKKAALLVMEAIAEGINYFDTAYMYPGNEEALGAALEKNGVREKVFIATKMPVVVCKSGADFDKFFGTSLERLRTKYIDYYLMHMLTDIEQWKTLCAWGIESWIAEQKKQGRIRQIGFSFHGARDEFLKVIDAYDWDFCQIQYNYSDENFQAGVTGLKRAAEKNLPVIVMEPLLGGKLTTGLPAEAVRIFAQADSDASPAEWAFRWLYNQPEVTVALSGMTEKNQITENSRIAEKAGSRRLGEADMEVFRRVLDVIRASFKIRCTGCNYCMPCPQHVNIPGCFSSYNASFSMGFVAGMKQYTTSAAMTSEITGEAGRCVKCGKCEQLCPQHIPIIQSLADVRRRMEPFWYTAVISLVRRFLRRGRAVAA